MNFIWNFAVIWKKVKSQKYKNPTISAFAPRAGPPREVIVNKRCHIFTYCPTTTPTSSAHKNISHTLRQQKVSAHKSGFRQDSIPCNSLNRRLLRLEIFRPSSGQKVFKQRGQHKAPRRLHLHLTSVLRSDKLVVPDISSRALAPTHTAGRGITRCRINSAFSLKFRTKKFKISMGICIDFISHGDKTHSLWNSNPN